MPRPFRDITRSSLVRDVRKARKRDQNIVHACEDEAKFIFQELFRYAIKKERKVRIVSSKFYAPFFDQLEEDITHVMDQNIKVELLVLSPNGNLVENKFIAAVNKHGMGTVILNPHDKEIRSPSFVLVGDSAYRIRMHPKEAKAVANFENAFFGKFLQEEFDDIKAQLQNK